MNKGEFILSLVGLALQASLCVLLLLRRSYRQFPLFAAFTIFSVFYTAVLLAINSNPALYAKVFWTGEVIIAILTLFSLQEAFRAVFRNLLGLRWFGWLFPGVGLLMIGVTLLRTLVLPRPAYSLFSTTIINMEIGFGFLEFGIFGLFIVLIGIFQLPWRQCTLGTVAGFGVAAAGSLGAFLLRSEFGAQFNRVVRIVPAIAYMAGLTIWIPTFWKPEASCANQDAPQQKINPRKPPDPGPMAASGPLF